MNGGVIDLMLTDVPNVVGVQVGSAVETSNQAVTFIDVLCNLFFTWCVGRRFISRTLLTGSWLREI